MVSSSLYLNYERYNAVNKAVIIGIIVAIVIGITASSALIYIEDDKIDYNAIDVNSTPESEPKQFSVELNEGIGVSDEP